MLVKQFKFKTLALVVVAFSVTPLGLFNVYPSWAINKNPSAIK